jgi:hypothetical protein
MMRHMLRWLVRLLRGDVSGHFPRNLCVRRVTRMTSCKILSQPCSDG